MPNYVCIVYARDDRVLKVEDFERDGDERAIREAVAVAESIQDCRGYELWRAGRRISSNLPK